MSPLTETASDTCYDCGREVVNGREVAACLWKSPAADGAEFWGPVALCPECARRRDHWHQTWLSAVVVIVVLVTAALAYPFVP